MVDFAGKGQEIQDDLIRIRRLLHQIPEVGLDLPETQKVILAELEGLPLDITLGTSCSSVVAVLTGGKPGPTVLLRGDMDGLPVHEASGEPFASTNGNMHACGHDLHISSLIGAARLLSEVKDELPGKILFMFQPGEEGYSGAKVMIDDGLLETTGEKPVAAFGTHVMSNWRAGELLTRIGPFMASSNDLYITVQGRGGHGSMPTSTIDPVPILAEIILALQTYVTRKINTFDPVVISATQLEAGRAINVIADTAKLSATVRTLSTASTEQLERELPVLASGIASAYGATAETVFHRLYPVTLNDPEITEHVVELLKDEFGAGEVELVETPAMGAEDFSFVLNEVPGTFVIVGACPTDIAEPLTGPSNHSARVRFDDSVLGVEAATLALLGYSALVERSLAPVE